MLLLGGCAVHRVDQCPEPEVCLPNIYGSNPTSDNVAPTPASTDQWWRAFGDPTLESIVEQALENNLVLSQAWHRLAQADAQACVARAGYWPELVANFGTNHTRTLTSGAGVPFTIPGTMNRHFLTPSLSYEVDIWRRVASGASARGYDAVDACETAHATALTLTGTVTDLWLTVQEQRSLEQLLHEQIAVNKTLLELVELRFSLGDASALDVYQQRQQLKNTELQLPAVLATYRIALHQLNVLIGQAPSCDIEVVSDALLPTLPPLPHLETPCCLLERRPDLRAARARLVAADYDVAVAVADRFPRLNLTLSYDFSATEINELFTREVGTILGNFMAPIFDAGRRRCEADRRKAIVCERLDAFGQATLDAVAEVEDAIVNERYRLDLLALLDEQLQISRQNLTEARSRYLNGLNDYLTVIAAVQVLQGVERRIVTEEKNLLSNRAVLYRALGGYWYDEQQDCSEDCS